MKIFLGLVTLLYWNFAGATELVEFIPFSQGQAIQCQGEGSILLDNLMPSRVGQVATRLDLSTTDQYPGPQEYVVYLGECKLGDCGSTWGGSDTFELRGVELYREGVRAGAVSKDHLSVTYKTKHDFTVTYEINLESVGRLGFEKKAFDSKMNMVFHSVEHCKSF